MDEVSAAVRWLTTVGSAISGAIMALMIGAWRLSKLQSRVDVNERQTAENKQAIKELREAVHHIDVNIAGMGASLEAIKAAVAPGVGEG